MATCTAVNVMHRLEGEIHPYLSASIAELCEGRVEKTVLFVKGSYICICMRLRSLESHVCVGDFGNRRTERFQISVARVNTSGRGDTHK